MSKKRQTQRPEDSALYGDTDDQVIQGHNYDGIKEYDNPMPGWWVWLFVATVVFAVVYYVGIEFFGFIDTREDDLSESMAELQSIRTAYEEEHPSFTPDEATLQQYIDDPAMVEAGSKIFTTYCTGCHGPQGQGVIGPNLTDKYWIHGDTNQELFRVITEGVPAKGMTPWGPVLSPEERAQALAFVRSIQGSNPPNAKAPQGDLYQ